MGSGLGVGGDREGFRVWAKNVYIFFVRLTSSGLYGGCMVVEDAGEMVEGGESEGRGMEEGGESKGRVLSLIHI